MPRITYVKNARKQHHCSRCGRTIKVGEPYRWFARKTGPASGYTIKRCMECPVWRPSELTANQYQAAYLSACETFEDAKNETIDDIVDNMRAVAEAARENAETLRESAQNMEDGFGHSTWHSEELEDRAEGWEQFADDIENEAIDIESEEVEDFDSEEEMIEEMRDRAESAISETPE